MRFYNVLGLLILLVIASCTSGDEQERAMNQLEQQLKQNQIEAEPELEGGHATYNSQPEYITVFEQPEEMPDACIPIMNDLFGVPDRDLGTYLTKYLNKTSEQNEYYLDYETGDTTDKECGTISLFDNGVRYSVSNCNEIGWDMSLKTHCHNRDIPYYIINGIFTDPSNVWNTDSTLYEPADGGAGCYYHIEMEKDGYYSIYGHCGC